MSIACSINLNTTLTAEQRDRYQNGDQIQSLLASMRKIAMIGLSTESTKASNMVASYLLDEGFEVIPVHPKADTILGQKVYRSLGDVPFAVDVVNVFRPGHEMWDITDQAIANGAKAVWSQLRIINFDAGSRAIDAGIVAVQDKCIKMEHGRYGGMLHWAGMNTEIISAKRRLISR